MLDDALGALEADATELAGKAGFKLRGPFAQRHGGWVGVFVMRPTEGAGVERYVSLGVSENSECPGGSLLVELTAIAEDANFAAREAVSSFALELADFSNAATREWFKVTFEKSLRTARRLVPTALKPLCIFPPQMGIGVTQGALR